jgi:hypothetical protein
VILSKMAFDKDRVAARPWYGDLSLHREADYLGLGRGLILFYLWRYAEGSDTKVIRNMRVCIDISVDRIPKGLNLQSHLAKILVSGNDDQWHP